MSDHTLLAFNSGSSSIKLGLFAIEPSGVRAIGGGEIDLRHAPLTLRVVQDGATWIFRYKAA